MASYRDAEFVFEFGECGNCDHNRYSIQYEEDDVFSYEEMEE